MTITGSNTTNFGFQKLGSNDDAGYSTINEVVDGIDTILNASDRLLKSGLTPTLGYTIKWDGSDWISGTLDSAGITNSAIIDTKIATDAVTTSKIIDGAVTSAKIADGTIVNGDINSAAAIVDTKLATISTAGKVANSATTASSSNGGSTIVSRDASGNFAADTITASLSGTATRATNIVGGSAGNIPYQTGTSATGLLASGSDGQVLTYSSSGSAPTWANISSGSVTLAGDVTGAANANTISNNAITQAKMADNSVGTAEIIDANVSYTKLGTSAKTYFGPVSISTSTLTLTTDHTSIKDSGNPFVSINAACAITLPTAVGIVGCTITLVCRTSGAVTLAPVSPTQINDSNSNTYTIPQYGVVSLICVAGNSWIITGDYA